MKCRLKCKWLFNDNDFFQLFNNSALEYCYINSWHSELKKGKSIKYKDRGEHSITLHLMCFISTYLPQFISNVCHNISPFLRVKSVNLSLKHFSTHGVSQYKQKRLTEGVPLVLLYCLGDVDGEVFGYRSRGEVILNVGAPCNGPYGEKTQRNIFFLSLNRKKHWLMDHSISPRRAGLNGTLRLHCSTVSWLSCRSSVSSY